jgi:hypothetical protein
MRTISLGIVVAVMIASLCFGQDAQQQTSRSSQLLENLRSTDLATRRRAFEDVRSNSAMLRDPNAQSALFDLLHQESRDSDAEIRESERKRAAHEKDNSEPREDAMYINDLLRTIESFADFRDSHQICLLAKAGAMLDSPDARESAARVQVAMPCLEQLSKSDLFMDRLNAVRILIRLRASADGSLDPGTAGTIKQAIALALHDKRTEVQWEAVDWLARDGTQDMISALRELATSVPGSGATEDEIAVRTNAAKAITAIEQREAHQ